MKRNLWVCIIFIFLLLVVLGLYQLSVTTANSQSSVIYYDNIEQYSLAHPPLKTAYPTYYLNLDICDDRNGKALYQLSRISDHITRIPAVNGFLISDCQKQSIQGVSFINHFNTLTKQELGCLLSHLQAIKTAYSHGDMVAFIFEDDIVTSTASFHDPIDSIINNAPSNWELLKFTAGTSNIVGHPGKLQYLDYEKHPQIWSNAGYAINRKGMKRILDIVGYDHFTLSKSASYRLSDYDGVADVFIPKLLLSYIIMPSPFTMSYTASTIQQSSWSSYIQWSCYFQTLKYYNSLILENRIYISAKYDYNFCRQVFKLPFTTDINSASLLVRNVLTYDGVINKPSILIDREPFNYSQYQFEGLVISCKHPNSGCLPKCQSLYVPCYSFSFAENAVSPLRLIKDGSPPPKKSKFCAFVYSNSKSMEGVNNRIAFFKLMQQMTGGRIDSWGRCQNNMKIKGDLGHTNNITLFRDYKFVIAFENNYPSGYISEKLTNPMVAGAIPIYLGDPEVGQHFNSKSFINVRDYKSWEACIEYILFLDKNESEYNKLYREPWLKNNRLTEHFSWWDRKLGNFHTKLEQYLAGVGLVNKG